MSINTKKYIEEYIKIRDKNGKVIPLKLNEPQMKYYNVIKELHEQRKPIRIIRNPMWFAMLCISRDAIRK